MKHRFFYSCFDAVRSEISEPEYYHPDKYGGRMVYNDKKILTILLRPKIESPIGKALNVSRIKN